MVAPQVGGRSRRAGPTGWAVAALAVAVPVAIWWMIGDLSFRPNDPDSLDYMWRQPTIDPAFANAAGWLAVLVVVASLFTLVWAARGRVLDSRWWLVVVLVTMAGIGLAVIERMVTAGVVGANIGGGLALFVGVPMVALALIAALTVSIWMWTSPRTELPPRPR